MCKPGHYPVLERIDAPVDLRKLPEEELVLVAAEVRDLLIHTVCQTGGHLAASLGTVELTIALHYIYDTRKTGWSGTWATRPIPTRS